MPVCWQINFRGWVKLISDTGDWCNFFTNELNHGLPCVGLQKLDETDLWQNWIHLLCQKGVIQYFEIQTWKRGFQKCLVWKCLVWKQKWGFQLPVGRAAHRGICPPNHFKSMQSLADAISTNVILAKKEKNTLFIIIKSIKETLGPILIKMKKNVKGATVVEFQNKT